MPKKKLKKQKQKKKKKFVAKQTVTETSETSSYNSDNITNLQNITKNGESSDEDVAQVLPDINSITQGKEAGYTKNVAKKIVESKCDVQGNEIRRKVVENVSRKQKQDVTVHKQEDCNYDLIELIFLNKIFQILENYLRKEFSKDFSKDSFKCHKHIKKTTGEIVKSISKDQTIKDDEDSIEYYSNIGFELIFRNNNREAAIYFQRACALDPNNVSISINLSFCHLNLKNYPQAVYYALKAITYLQKSILLLRESDIVNKSYYQVQKIRMLIKAVYLFGKSNYKIEEYNVAEACFKTMLEIIPNSTYLQRELLLVEIAKLKKEGYSEEESLDLLFKEAQDQDTTSLRKNLCKLDKKEEISYDYDENEIYNSDTEDWFKQFRSENEKNWNKTKSIFSSLLNTTKLKVLTNLRLQKEAEERCKKHDKLLIDIFKEPDDE